MLQKQKIEREIIFFSGGRRAVLLREDMDLYVRHMSLSKSGEHWFKKAPLNNGAALHIALEGEGIIQYGDKEYNMSPGRMLVIWPGAPMLYLSGPKSSWWYKWVWLAGTKVRWALSQAGVTPENCFFDVSDCENFLDCLERTERVFSGGEYPALYPVQAAWEIVGALERDIIPELGSGVPGNLAEMCRILIENYSDTFSNVGKLARHFKVDRATVFRSFKESFGISPKEHIEKVKFERACQLLSMTEMKIKEIADICGYESQCYFSLAFRKRFGRPPAEWRKERGEKSPG